MHRTFVRTGYYLVTLQDRQLKKSLIIVEPLVVSVIDFLLQHPRCPYSLYYILIEPQALMQRKEREDEGGILAEAGY